MVALFFKSNVIQPLYSLFDLSAHLLPKLGLNIINLTNCSQNVILNIAALLYFMFYAKGSCLALDVVVVVFISGVLAVCVFDILLLSYVD